jgi:hypothetical protein
MTICKVCTELLIGIQGYIHKSLSYVMQGRVVLLVNHSKGQERVREFFLTVRS